MGRWTVVCTIGTMPGMTGQELRAQRRRLGLTQRLLAERVGVTSTSVARWERGERGISEPVARLVRLLAETAASPRRRQRR